MRSHKFVVFAALALIAACSETSSSTSDTTGGGGTGGATTGSTTGGTATTSDGGGGSATTSTTTTTTTTGSGGTTTTTTDLCETAGTDPVSFAGAVQPIFSQSCGNNTACHLKSTPSEGLSLKAGQAYADLVDVAAVQDCNGQLRVEPGSASGSYLVNKIMATGVCPNEKKMPPQSTLSDAKKQTIIDWICQGAQNN